MGLLTPSIPPWHPAPEGLRSACKTAGEETGGSLPDIALGYAIRTCAGKYPLVAGFSQPKEVHECVRVWREIQADGEKSSGRADREETVKRIFEQSGYMDWSWASP